MIRASKNSVKRSGNKAEDSMPYLNPTTNSDFEIGHVLFIDIVGYSKLLIEEQKERLEQLTKIVPGTAQVRSRPMNNSLGFQLAMGWRWSFTTAQSDRSREAENN